MAPPSKKQKWRQLDLSATEQHIDDAALHERIARLEASDDLFQIDTSGCEPGTNLTQKARRLLQQQQKLLAAGDGKGEGDVLQQQQTAAEPKTFSLTPKKPLLQAISSHHKKQLMKVMRRQQEKKNKTMQQQQSHVSPAAAGASATADASAAAVVSAAGGASAARKSLTTSRCFYNRSALGGKHKEDLQDLWPAENIASCGVNSSSSSSKVVIYKGKQKEATQQDKQHSSERTPHATPAAPAATPAADGDDAAAGDAAAAGSESSARQQVREEGGSLQFVKAEEQQQQQQARGKRSRNTQKEDKAAAATATAVTTAADEGGVAVSTRDAAAAGAGAAAVGGEEALREGDRWRHEEVVFKNKKRVACRRLKSFDELRPYIPAVRLPGDSESYNPSAEATACGLLAAAVRSLEEEREMQHLQASSRRRTVTHEAQQQQNQEKLELLLWANMQQRELDRGDIKRYSMTTVRAHTPAVQAATAAAATATAEEEARADKSQKTEEKEENEEQPQRECYAMKRVDHVLLKVFPPQDIMLLSDTQKQRLLLELAYNGKASLPSSSQLLTQQQQQANAEQQQQQQETKKNSQQQQEASIVTSQNKAANADGVQDAEGGNTSSNHTSLVRTKRMEKKTRAERNRRLRFLQQQRRHAAKLATSTWRAALDRVESMLHELDEEEQELTLRKRERNEKLHAKILAAKQGHVRLKLGRELRVTSVNVQNRFVEAPPAVQLPADVSGNLRATKPAVGAAGALSEYVASLRRRGLLELPFGGITSASLRHAKKQQRLRLASRKPRKRKD